jgi:hypothetical protein
MTATVALLEHGYQVVPVVGHFNIFHAHNQMTGDNFLFSVRGKQSPSFRRKTNTWELGIDVPDYGSYVTAGTMYPHMKFVVFFDIETPKSTRWILLSDIQENGRFWWDESYFPNGIYFVPVSSTNEWKQCPIFTIQK